jgi:murein peptide amidase A
VTAALPRAIAISLLAVAAVLTSVALASPAGGSKDGTPIRHPRPTPAHSGLERRLAQLLRLTSKPCCYGRNHAGALLGRSAEGRPIRVEAWPSAAGTAFGANPRAKVLVFGCIHGTECAGRKVIPRIVSCPPYTGVWAVPNLNPDGFAQGTRLNGRGVDLNRNFPSSWTPIGVRYDLEYSGRHPFSEPETRLAARLIRLIRPRITIWFHQEVEPMVRAWGQSVPIARRYARLADLPFHRLPWLAGTGPNWQNHRFPGTSSFVVELPPGPLTGAAAAHYGDAIFQLTRFAIHPMSR